MVLGFPTHGVLLAKASEGFACRADFWWELIFVHRLPHLKLDCECPSVILVTSRLSALESQSPRCSTTIPTR